MFTDINSVANTSLCAKKLFVKILIQTLLQMWFKWSGLCAKTKFTNTNFVAYTDLSGLVYVQKICLQSNIVFNLFTNYQDHI